VPHLAARRCLIKGAKKGSQCSGRGLAGEHLYLDPPERLRPAWRFLAGCFFAPFARAERVKETAEISEPVDCAHGTGLAFAGSNKPPAARLLSVSGFGAKGDVKATTAR